MHDNGIMEWFEDTILGNIVAGILILFGGLLALLALLLIVGTVIFYPLGRMTCDDNGREMGRDTKFTYPAMECYVESDSGKWVDTDNFRVNENGDG